VLGEVVVGVTDNAAPDAYVLSLLAEEKHEAALDAIPEFGYPHLYAPHFVQLGYRLWRTGSPEEAVPVLRRALRLDPDLPSAWLTLGMVLLGRDQLQEGDRCLAEAVLRDAALSSAHYLRGVVAATSGREPDAAGHFADCLEVDPAHGSAASELRSVLDSIPAGDPVRSRAEAVLARAPSPADTSSRRATLSVCLITKDEEEALPRCLRSLKPVADQIVVVDTGSTDDTREIARSFGADVHEFTWADDFAAARNAAVEHATCDWILIVDADEELTLGSAAQLRDLLTQPIAGSVCQLITLALSRRPGRLAPDLVGHPRLFRRGEGIHFEGAIHEQLVDREGRPLDSALATGIVVHHHGYLESPAAMAERGERNLRLLAARLEAEPDNPYLLFHLGHARLGCGRIEEAVPLLKRAGELAEEGHAFRTKAIILLSDALRLLGRPGEAEDALRAGLASHPDHPELLCALGLILEQQDKSDQAIEAYRAATRGRFGPIADYQDFACRDAVPRGRLAAIYLSRGETGTALGELKAALALRPEATDLRHLLASAFIALGQYQQARYGLDSLLAGDPDDALAHNMVGVSFALERDHTKAAREFELALALRPHDVDVLCNLAAACHGLGDLSRARDTYEVALKHRPSHVQAWLGLAKTYLDSGAYQSSVHCYEMAARHSGGAPDVMSEIAAARARLVDLAQRPDSGERP
jgi:tetratricopeptide (TPR) repeat protein